MLDEATSATGSLNERSIIESIGVIRVNYTTVVVTYYGNAVECGAPSELAVTEWRIAR